MKILKTAKDASAYFKKKAKKGCAIGLVPTMGCLHEGHLSLIKAAKRANDITVLSIFVNPTQFGPKEDYRKYPRDFVRDEKLARKAGVDAVFYPSSRQMYPPGYKTYVNVEDITEKLCGASRPGHFKGVATVVAKLLNIVKPDAAYFGQKDAQQAIVIKRMADDLNIDTAIKILPIVREKDGLAMSSRNAYLSQKERQDALILKESLDLAESLIKGGLRDARKIRLRMKYLIGSKKSARIDYITVAGAEDLKERRRIGKDTLIALAVWIGKTRLIDNIIIGGKL